MLEIPFYRKSIDSINDSYLRSAMADNCSKFISDFENDFKKYIGCEYAVSTINAYTAIHLALCAVDIKRGDKILCSVNIHPSIPSAIRQFDAEPIFVDVDETTYNMDLDKLQETLKERKVKKLRGIVVSFIGGQPIDMEKFAQIVRKNKIFVIEDATDALGATFKNKRIGSFNADMTIFSFMPFRKNIPAQGAMLTTNDDELYEKAILMRNHAIKKDETKTIEYLHDVVGAGCDYNMSGLDAAYCRTVFDNLESDLKRRKEIAAKYIKELTGLAHVKIEKAKFDHSYYTFTIKIDKNRDDFSKELAKKGIETDIEYMPIHMSSYYRAKYELKINSFPVALRVYGTVLSIPIYAGLSEKEIDFIISAIKDIANKRKW